MRRHAVGSRAASAGRVLATAERPTARGGYSVGFGRAVAGGDGDKSDWRGNLHKADRRAALHVYQPRQKPGNLYDLLVAETTVPVRGLFVLVLLFGVGIGPANLWLLSRYKRRIWLWWNVPAISLLTCLVVFGYSLASEGMDRPRQAWPA